MLARHLTSDLIECGCDEAGRGCLAGAVYAAAVVFPKDYHNPQLNDSKQLTPKQRELLRATIENDAVAWAVAAIDAQEIDRINILRASLHAMNLAVAFIAQIKEINNNCAKVFGNSPPITPELLLIDGNKFYNETLIPYQCIVKGDAKYISIAAASILAKTYRDKEMERLHELYPHYGWDRNKGYPTQEHYAAIAAHGITPYHRRSYKLVKDRNQTIDN